MESVKKAQIFNASWVTAPKEYEAPIIMRKFRAEKAKNASLEISALGFFLPYINGKRVGNEYFLPSNSLFCKRKTENFTYPISDEFTYRCYYTVYDISDYLTDGENILEIALGNGWYRQTERITEGNMSFGDSLGTIFAVTFTDDSGERTILSDGTEVCRTDKTVSSHLFYGETIDFRINNYLQSPVQIKKIPETILTPEATPPDRLMRKLTPLFIFQDDDRAIYDVGENVSGFAVVEVNAAVGEKVVIRYAEKFDGTGLDFKSAGSGYKNADGMPQIMQDTVIGDGQSHIFEPKFVWHAFRYFEIEGSGRPISVNVIHSDIAVTANFNSSSPELNWLFSAFIRTQADNMHGGVPSDCPHRERLGYTGDGQVCAPAAMLMFDGRKFYKKWIRDIFDSQDRIGGHVNHTAPFAGGGGGPGGWGMAAITVPYNYFKIYGDITPAKENFEGIKKWVDYLVKHSEKGLITHEEVNGWCLGDWCMPEKPELSEIYVNTCLFIRGLNMAIELAGNLDNNFDAEYFKGLRQTAVKAVKSKYFNESTGEFAGENQGAGAFALAAGIGNDNTLLGLQTKYKALKRFDTGFLGTDLLTEVLFENGCEDIVFDMLVAHSVGGFGYFYDMDLTTIPETWTADASLNHPMFGACSRMLISGILGIKQEDNSYGFKNIIISPKIPKSLKWANGGIRLADGHVNVKWEKSGQFVLFKIRLPKNRKAFFEYGNTKCVLSDEENTIEAPLQHYTFADRDEDAMRVWNAAKKG